MQPIIRRTLTITITETWTITWPNGQETVWHTIQETVEPASREPGQSLPQIAGDDDEFEFDTDPMADEP